MHLANIVVLIKNILFSIMLSIIAMQFNMITMLNKERGTNIVLQPTARMTEAKLTIDELLALPTIAILASPKQIKILMQNRLFDSEDEAKKVPRKNASKIIKKLFEKN